MDENRTVSWREAESRGEREIGQAEDRLLEMGVPIASNEELHSSLASELGKLRLPVDTSRPSEHSQ